MKTVCDELLELVDIINEQPTGSAREVIKEAAAELKAGELPTAEEVLPNIMGCIFRLFIS